MSGNSFEQSQSGVLGTVHAYSDWKFAEIMELGVDIGRFQALLHDENQDGPEHLSKCGELLQEIQTGIDLCHLPDAVRHYKPEDRTKNKKLVVSLIRSVEQGLVNRSWHAHAVYFSIGTAAGLLLHPNKELAEGRFHAMDRNYDGDFMEAFYQLSSVTKPLGDGLLSNALNDFKRVLKELQQTITILFVAAENHLNERPVNVMTEVKAIEKELKQNEKGGKYRLVFGAASNLDDFHNKLRELKPRVVHFSGHGNTQGIVFTGDDNKGGKLVPMKNLVGILKDSVQHGLKTLFLNSCDSFEQSHSIAAETGIETMITIKGDLRNENALRLSTNFYRNLANGEKDIAAFNGAKRFCELTADTLGPIEPILIWNGSSGEKNELHLDHDAKVELQVEIQEEPPATLTSGPGTRLLEAPPVSNSKEDGPIGAVGTSDSRVIEVLEDDDKGDATKPDHGVSEGTKPVTRRAPKLNAPAQAAPAQPPQGQANDEAVSKIVESVKVLLHNPDFLKLGQIWRGNRTAFDATLRSWLQDAAKMPMLEVMFQIPRDIVEKIWKDYPIPPPSTAPTRARANNAPAPSPRRQGRIAADPFDMFADFFGRTNFFGVTYTNPFSSLSCNRCENRFSIRGGYHCSICHGGDFDVCAGCVGNGIGCLNSAHRLVAWVVHRS